MNIACDARALVGPHTGVGIWTSQVMGGLVRDHDHRVLLAASKPIDLSPELNHDGVRIVPPPRPPLPGTLWLHTLLPARLAQSGAEVFVGSLAILPRRCPIPAVAMVHDITPRTHPQHHTLANRFCFNAYLEESLERAHVVVAGSVATEELLLEYVPSVRGRIARIGYGVDPVFAPSDGDGSEARRRFAAGRPYILHLGTIEPRKGVLDLVAAWESVWQSVAEPPDLVLAGGLGWDTDRILQRIDDSPYRPHLHLTGYVSRSDALLLLQHASVFVLASEAEGFGLPLAEAISCGTACVASDIPPLREAGGDAVLYAPPHDAAALADAIVDALDPHIGSQLRIAAALRAPELRWDPVVESWHSLLCEVINGRQRR